MSLLLSLFLSAFASSFLFSLNRKNPATLHPSRRFDPPDSELCYFPTRKEKKLLPPHWWSRRENAKQTKKKKIHLRSLRNFFFLLCPRFNSCNPSIQNITSIPLVQTVLTPMAFKKKKKKASASSKKWKQTIILTTLKTTNAVHQAVLREQWNNRATIIIFWPCFVMNDLVLFSYSKQLPDIASSPKFVNTLGSSSSSLS